MTNYDCVWEYAIKTNLGATFSAVPLAISNTNNYITVSTTGSAIALYDLRMYVTFEGT